MKREIPWWGPLLFFGVIVAGILTIGDAFEALDDLRGQRIIFESECKVETAVVQKVHYHPSQRIIGNRFDFLASRYAPPFYTVALKMPGGEMFKTTISAPNQNITKIKKGQEIKIETYKTVARADDGRILLPRTRIFRSFK
jgi:hypothetical protein